MIESLQFWCELCVSDVNLKSHVLRTSIEYTVQSTSVALSIDQNVTSITEVSLIV